MAANKVQFNLKHVHYAVLTEGATPTWATPVAVPGAVNLSLDANGEVSPFYADGVVYYQSIANNGYTGTLEMAKIPDAMLADVFGFAENTTDGVLYEDASTEPKPFALMFQIDGDEDQEYYTLFRCLATRPPIASATNTETKEPQTASMDISALPLNADGKYAMKVLARTMYDTTTTVKSGWFSSVWSDFN